MCELVWALLGKVLKKKLGSDKTPPLCSVYTCTRKSTVRDIADSVIVHLHDYETCKIEIMWMCGCESFIYFTPLLFLYPPVKRARRGPS